MLIGIDVGGTSFKTVGVRPSGEIATRSTTAIGGGAARDALLDAIAGSVVEVSGNTRITGVGLAFGGIIRPDGTMHAGSTNLPNLAGLPLEAVFTECLGHPCRIDHDARAAMRGEGWLGAARGVDNAMTITLGTGIGAGLLLDGRIYAGTLGAAGEIGMWRLADPSADGSGPVVEDLASPARVERRTGRPFAETFAAHLAGREAVPAIDVALGQIGRAIANAHLLLDLEAVVVIGAVTAIGEPLRQAVETAFLKACPGDYRGKVSIQLGILGAYAGAVGAAALLLEGQKA